MREASCRAAPVLEHTLGEGDDEHLARRVSENVVDRWREETRLAAPARRRPEHDQVRTALDCSLDDRLAEASRPKRPAVHLDAVVRA